MSCPVLHSDTGTSLFARAEGRPDLSRMPSKYEWSSESSRGLGAIRCSLNEVCRRLQKAGELTASGRRVWSKQAVWHILQNPAYVGRAAYGKTRMMPRESRRPRRLPCRPSTGRWHVAIHAMWRPSCLLASRRGPTSPGEKSF